MPLTLIKNATLVTMDPAIGDLETGDLLIDGEKIAAVGRNLSAPGATVLDASGRIAMPGLVNAHIHTWEYQLRGIGSDWVGIRDYHANMHKNLATRYRARDVYLGNLLGALNQSAPAPPPSSTGATSCVMRR
jgi:cytosine/adenosine deaminase-related metal-dependent hydrolase